MINLPLKTNFLCDTLIDKLMLSHFIASLCSPSVLDRLNPLLEPNGVLSIDGRGVVGDSVPPVTPHPNFRYILSCIHIAIGQETNAL